MPDLSTFLTPEVLEITGGAAAVVAVFAGFVYSMRRARKLRPPAPPPVPPPTLPSEVVEPPEGAVAVEPAAVPVPAAAPPAKRAPDWRGGLAKSRAGLIGKLEGLLRGKSALDAA